MRNPPRKELVFRRVRSRAARWRALSVAKRAELAGQKVDLDRQKAALKAQLRHVDHTLAIFGYADPPRDIPPKRPHVYRFKRRELPKLIRQIEAETAGQTNRAIALRVMELKCWDTDDRELVRKVTESVKGAKNWQNRKAKRYGLPVPNGAALGNR